jgi:hypothetical protein
MELAPDWRFVPALRLPMEAASTSTGLQLANAESTGYDTQPSSGFRVPERLHMVQRRESHGYETRA